MQPEIDITTSAHLEIDKINHHTKLPETAISKQFERVILVIGNLFSWIWVLLMAVIIINVVMRYVLGYGRIEFEELQWHLYAAGWLIGLSYCYVADDHVRVDLIHDRLTLKKQAWIEFLGIIFLLAPFIVLVLWYSVPFILYSWDLGEVSGAPGGLPYRWIMKGVLFVGFALLLVATISRFSRVYSLLFSSKKGTAVKQSKG
ncbi:MAG: C4-dicarboxylate ABC transporter permease [Gammaproteobacteria bacterium]|nr:MAG: C4-dicarboxylate ABC transporter permease [Gammaproteobacteria bacterium]PHR83798.1 MAG: C4-dicarboxylate ABC transporter permease [Colwellia sp.]